MSMSWLSGGQMIQLNPGLKGARGWQMCRETMQSVSVASSNDLTSIISMRGHKWRGEAWLLLATPCNDFSQCHIAPDNQTINPLILYYLMGNNNQCIPPQQTCSTETHSYSPLGRPEVLPSHPSRSWSCEIIPITPSHNSPPRSGYKRPNNEAAKYPRHASPR